MTLILGGKSFIYLQASPAYQSLGREENGYAKIGFKWGWSLNDRFGSEMDDQYMIVEPLKADPLPPADSSIDDSTWKWTNGFLNNSGIWVRTSVPLERPESELLTDKEKMVYALWQNISEKDYYSDDEI